MQLALAAGVTPGALLGNLLTFSRSGLSQEAVVLAQLADSSFLLAAPLDFSFTAGDTVTVYPAAGVITARSRGFWGNRIRLDFTELDAGAFGLRVTLDLGPDTLPKEQEFYRRLTPDTAASVLQAESNLIAWSGGAGPLWFDSVGPLGSRVAYLSGGRDGLADVKLADFTGADGDRRGLRLLEEIDEVSIIAVPDAVLTTATPLVAPPPVLPPCTPPPAEPAPVLPPDPTGVPTPLSPDDRLTLQMLMIEQ